MNKWYVSKEYIIYNKLNKYKDSRPLSFDWWMKFDQIFD